MKKFLKILAALFIVVIIAMVAIPYIYKDKIVAYVKADINKSVNAKVDFKDVDLSLFRSFPNFSLGLQQLTVDGVDTFKDVRLLDVAKMNLTLDIKSVLGGNQIKINKIAVDKAKVTIYVTEDGKANYDIAKDTGSDDSESSNFNIDLKNYTVKNTDIVYDDKSMGFLAEIKNLNHEGSGKLTNEIYELQTKSTIDTLTIAYGGIKYLNRVKAEVNTGFDISGDFAKYTLKNTEATINDLPLKADGYVEMKENEIVMDINYSTENANIAQLLSLVPKEYMPDLSGVKTGGTAKISGYVKGHSTDTDLPGFKLLVDVQNASIQYPDLPEKVSNINLLTDVDFKGGSDLNTMTVDISKIVFDIAGSRVTGNLNVKQPMTDPFISAAFKSKLDFSKVKNAVKFEQIKDLSGLLDADISLASTVSAITNQQVDKINAKGYFNLTNFKMKSDSFDKMVQIPNAQMDITPSSLKVNSFNALLGENDLSVSGSVSNYLAYALGKNEVLKGAFTAKSKSLNLNDFMTETTATTPTQDTKETTSSDTGIIKVPENIDFTMSLSADKVKYQKLDLNNVIGKLIIANQEVKLSDVTMSLLGGTVSMAGTYNTAGEKAKANLSLGLQQLGIKESATSLDMFSSFAPVLSNVSGKFFSDLNMNLDFNDKMEPVLSSVSAKGLFKTDEISTNGVSILKKVGEILKINELTSSPKIDKLNASFTIKDGTLTLKPNEFKINGMQAGLSGTFNLDNQLNMELTLDVPREKLGSNINNVISNIAGVANKLDLTKDIGETVKTKFKITGSATNPVIKPVLLGSGGQALTSTVTETVQTKVQDVKNDALVKAQAEADKLVAEAKVQRDKLIQESEKLAQETRDKAQQGADDLIKQAGDNPLKKLAAQKAAEKLVKEGDKKADQIVSTATAKGDDLVQKAQVQADDLVNKAK